MKNLIRLGLAGLFLSTLGFKAFADTPKDVTQMVNMSLEDLMNTKVTSSAGREQKQREVASAMTVITKEDIARSGAQNIPDLFYRVPGMEVRKLDGHRYYVSIRSPGSMFEGNTLVLVDGVVVFNTLRGMTNWEQVPVTLSEIERIEIIRGPGGVLYSSNAVNGVISIITKKATDQEKYVATRAGSQGMFLQELGAGQKINDKLSMRAYYQHDEDLGLVHKKGDINVKDSTNSEITGVKTEYDWSKDTSLVLDGKYLDDNAINDGQNTSLGDGNVIKRPGYQRTTSAQFQQKVNDVYDYNIHFDNMGMSTTDTTSLDSKSEAYTFNTQHNLRYDFFGKNVTSFGIEARYMQMKQVPGFAPPADSKSKQKVDSFFLQDEYRPTDKLILTAGTRIEGNTNVSPKEGLLYEPRVSAVYLLNDDNTLRAVVSRADHTPSFNDKDVDYLLGGGYAIRGSQDLEAEKNTTYELGWQTLMLNQKLSMDTSVFYSQIKDPIFLSSIWTPVGPDTLQYVVNNGSDYTIGAEWDIKYKITDDLTANADYTYINSAPRPNWEDGTSDYERYQSLGLSKHQAGVGLSYTKSAWTFDIYAKWMSKNTDTQDREIVTEIIKTPSYWESSMRVAYAFKIPFMKMTQRDAEIELVADDLFGALTEEAPHEYVREPMIYSGLKIKF